MEDSLIVDLYLQRSEDAIARTAESYGAKLKSISLNIVKDIQTAEECENDTYLQAWKSIPPNEPRSYLFAFLSRIIRHFREHSKIHTFPLPQCLAETSQKGGFHPMTSDELLNAMEHIDPELIEEADRSIKKQNTLPYLAAALAAMLAILIGISNMLNMDPQGLPQLETRPSFFPPTSGGNSHSHVSGTCSCRPLPSTRPTQPLTQPTTNPARPPNTVPLVNALYQPQIITGLQQIGSRPDYPNLAPTSPAYQFDIHMVVEARVKEVLPGEYQDPLTKRRYHILKLETLDVVSAENMPQEFYLRLSTQLSTELHIFTSFVLSIQQVGIENYLLLNLDQAQMEAFSLLFELYTDSHPFYFSYGELIAFSDGVWDKRLYELEGWAGIDAATSDYPVGKVSTIEECKTRILDKISKQNLTAKKVYTVADLAAGTAQEEFLAWVTPFTNGVYAQKFNQLGKVHYTRLINNFPTSETIYISQDGAYWLSEHFTQEDLSSLPDLGTFLMELQPRLETMASPHADFYKDTAAYLKGTWAEGKYYKVNGQVYGLVKVCWAYWTDRTANSRLPGSYIDAIYYLIRTDGSYVIAERDEIAQLLGEDFLEPEYDVLEPFAPI